MIVSQGKDHLPAFKMAWDLRQAAVEGDLLYGAAVQPPAHAQPVVATSIAFLPNRSSLVTISTASCSNLSMSRMRPGRCPMAELPNTVSDTTRRRLTVNPASTCRAVNPLL